MSLTIAQSASLNAVFALNLHVLSARLAVAWRFRTWSSYHGRVGRSGNDLVHIGACLLRTEVRPTLYCCNSVAKSFEGDCNNGRELTSRIKDSISIDLRERNDTVLKGRGGEAMFSKHWTAWWSATRVVTVVSDTRVHDSRVRIKSRVCHLPARLHLVGSLTSWTKPKESIKASKSRAADSSEPTWMLKSPALNFEINLWFTVYLN